MTVWKLIPVAAGAHVIARVHAGVSLEHLTGRGTLELRREEYGDLAVRLGHVGDAFDRDTGRPLTITVDDKVAPTAAIREARVPESAPTLKPADWGRTPTGDLGGAS